MISTTSIDNDIITNRHPADILPQSNNKSYTKMISQSNDIQGMDNFPMGCSFSPDGTCILTATSSDGKFRLYDTFQHLMNSTKSSNDTTVKPTENDINCKDENDTDVASKTVSTTRPQHETIQTTDSTTYSHNQNYQPQTTCQQPNNKEQQQYHSWSASLTSHQGGPPPSSSFASYCWYPLMTSTSPLTSLYATCRGHSMPIHLIDAYTSQLRASYCPYNAVDELEGPTVVEFSPDGRRIYATGFKSDRTIAVFDTSIPGRDGMIARLGKTRRSSDGQKGIPSSIAFPKCHSDDGPSNVFALGTYSPASIYIYDDRMSSHFQPAGTIVLHGGLTVVGHGRSFLKKKRRFNQVSNNNNQENGIQDTNDDNLFSSARVNWFQSRARGGITQLMWSPSTSNNPYLLFSASRRSNTVLSWDVRCLSGRDDFNGNQPVCGVQSYARDGDTNQRLEFDIDDTGKRIYVGSCDGAVKIYDITSGVLEDTLDVTSADDTRNNRVEKCTNAVNGVSFHHCNTGESGKYNVALLALAVGSRQYNELDSDEDEVGSGEKQRCPGFLQLQSHKE